jgi:hypothetical protein
LVGPARTPFETRRLQIGKHAPPAVRIYMTQYHPHDWRWHNWHPYGGYRYAWHHWHPHYYGGWGYGGWHHWHPW